MLICYKDNTEVSNSNICDRLILKIKKTVELSGWNENISTIGSGQYILQIENMHSWQSD